MKRRIYIYLIGFGVILSALWWRNSYVRAKAFRSSVEDILFELRDKGPTNEGRMIELCEFGNRAIPILMEGLKQGPLRYGHGALRRGFPAIGEPSVPVLIKALGDDDPKVRAYAAEIIGCFKIARDRFVPALIRALRDRASEVRANAAWSLGYFGADARGATAPLRRSLKDPDALVRRAAAYVLGEVAAPEPDVVASLLEVLRDDKNDDVRHSAARAIGHLDACDATVAVLLDLLRNDRDSGVRQAAAEGLEAHGVPDVAVPALVEILDDSDEDIGVRRACASAISELGPRGRVAIPALRRAMTVRQGYLWYTARYALESIQKSIDAPENSDAVSVQ
jgi:HEAT repeat protein